MLALTKKTEYGLIALTYLSDSDDKVCSAREISESCHIPLALLMNILKTLAQCDFIESIRGARGGYRLARPAEEITLAQVVKVLEGRVKLVQCVGDDGREVPMQNRCERRGRCTLRSPLLRIHGEFESFLRGITVAKLAADAYPKIALPHQDEPQNSAP